MTAAPTPDPGASDRHEPVTEHGELANAIRALAMDAVQAANSGHPGMPMGMADVATVLFGKFLRFDPTAPDWPDRDRFVLSAGHGSMLLYALLHLTGYPEMDIEQLKRFRQLGSRTAGHPEHGHAPGIETTTGPLGQGLANAVGMALAERHLRARFGAELVDHRTYAIVSDGDLMEGISHEACELAGHQRLDRLIRPVRRQPHHDRRLDRARVVDRPAAALRGLWLARRADRRPRSGGGRGGARRRSERRPAEPDRLPHHDRLWRADQGRHRRDPRLAARRRGDRRRPREARLAASAVRDPRADARRLAGVRQPRRRRARRLAGPARRAGGVAPGRVRAGPGGYAARRVRPGSARAQGAPGRGQAELGDPQVEPGGARGVHRGGPGADRRLGRSHRLGQHQDQDDGADDARRSGRPLCPLRRARARDGGGHERHGAAQGRDPLRRHVPDLLRLLPAGDPARRPDGPAGDLRPDPRFDRARRGWPDPSAGRASGRAARDPEPRRVPPGGRGRDRRVLGAGAGPRGRAIGAGADPAEPAGAAHHARGGQPLARRAPMS